jgi:peptidoglycan pentaglycine glycine transferase (the first glycine)
MRAQIITDRQQWNDFVAASELCNLTQTYEWGELMSKRHSDTLYVGVVNEDGSLCGAMLILVSTLPALHVPYFYAPRGPIIDDPASPAMTILLNFVKAEAHKRGACMLKVEPGVLDGDTKWLNALHHYGFRTIPYAHHLRHEWVTDIRADEPALLAKMHKKTRQYIRTSGRTGVTIREGGTPSDVDAFYQLYCDTSARSDFMVLSKEYYENFMRLYKDSAALLVAENEGRIIAAAIVMRLGCWSWNMYEAASEESRVLRINYLLQWERIRWAKSHGCWYFNSRGIPDNLDESDELSGVYTFKRGFGGYAMRSLVTHDLVYRPAIYNAYRVLLDGKHWYEKRQAEKKQAEEKRMAEQKQAEKPKSVPEVQPQATPVGDATPVQQDMPQLPETPRPPREPKSGKRQKKTAQQSEEQKIGVEPASDK